MGLEVGFRIRGQSIRVWIRVRGWGQGLDVGFGFRIRGQSIRVWIRVKGWG